MHYGVYFTTASTWPDVLMIVAKIKITTIDICFITRQSLVNQLNKMRLQFQFTHLMDTIYLILCRTALSNRLR